MNHGWWEINCAIGKTWILCWVLKLIVRHLPKILVHFWAELALSTTLHGKGVLALNSKQILNKRLLLLKFIAWALFSFLLFGIFFVLILRKRKKTCYKFRLLNGFNILFLILINLLQLNIHCGTSCGTGKGWGHRRVNSTVRRSPWACILWDWKLLSSYQRGLLMISDSLTGSLICNCCMSPRGWLL